MSVAVTGGAGFIGSCIVRMLNDMGIDDILVADHIASTKKWKNLLNKKYREYIPRDEFLEKLPDYRGRITTIIHMGACSSTMEDNFDFLYKNNFEYTKTLWRYCVEEQIPFIYASSAATYGAGESGFDDRMNIGKLRQLNGYGYSKQLFDLWAEKQVFKPVQHVGLKFFNVYGPNEYWKGTMASVIFQGFCQIQNEGEVKLFKSYRKDYEDGGQKRDFLYVKDLCEVIRFLIERPAVSGLFNLGTGTARSFHDLALAVFAAMDREPKLRYVDMPDKLKERYQYYTEAGIEKLRGIGYTKPFHTLEEGCRDYVCNYLMDHFGVW